jgi:hypothetical protein
MSTSSRKEFLEPLVGKVLGALVWFSPLSHTRNRTRRLVEIYVLCWYIASLVMIVLSQVFSGVLDRKYLVPLLAVFAVLSAYRIFDCITANMQISLLEVLNAKGREDRLTSRNVLLLGINFLEFLNNFSIIYFSLSRCGWLEFHEIDNIVDALYFSLSTITTLGFGDIHPLDTSAKLVVIAESLVGIAFLFIVLNVFVSTVQAARRKGG